MRRKRMRYKGVGVGLLALSLLFVIAAMAMAQPLPNSEAHRAGLAAAALADAHPSDRTLSYLAKMVQEETTRLLENTENQEQALNSFSRRAEEHLLSQNRNPEEAQHILRALLRQLRENRSPEVGQEQPGLSVSAKDMTVFGENLVVEANQVVKDVAVFGGSLTVRGHVLNSAVAFGGNVQVEPTGRIDGDVVSFGGHTVLSPHARVKGDTVALGGNVTVPEGAWVGGEKTQVDTETFSKSIPFSENSEEKSWSLLGVIWVVFKSVGLGLVMALLAIVIAALAPSRIRIIVSTIRQRPGMSFLSGILAFIVTMAASTILGITLIGIPLIPVLIFAVGIATVIGLTAVSCLIGETLPGKFKHDRSRFRCVILGVAILTVIHMIPVSCFGWLFFSAILSIALGAVYLSRVGAHGPYG